MNEQSRRVLILDIDPHTLVTLQHVLEWAEINTTITWDATEAVLWGRSAQMTSNVSVDSVQLERSRRDPLAVLEQVTRALTPLLFRGTSAKTAWLRLVHGGRPHECHGAQLARVRNESF